MVEFSRPKRSVHNSSLANHHSHSTTPSPRFRHQQHRAAAQVPPAAPSMPLPAMLPPASSQNIAHARSAPSDSALALQDLDTAWVDETLLPFLHYACIDIGLSASQLKDYALAASLWAYLHPVSKHDGGKFINHWLNNIDRPHHRRGPSLRAHLHVGDEPTHYHRY
jgi:hypothetical protein